MKNKKTSLTVVHLNTRSLLRHFDDVVALISTHRPEVLALSETWLDPSVDNCEINLLGYSLFRSDRNCCGGGIAVYCANHLPCSELSCGAAASSVEFLWISIKYGCFHPYLTLGCLYRPPSSPVQSVLQS